MKHLGDITQINGAEIEPVDVITAGSPCQDLSVAGKRAGLAGERSGLFMEQMRIIKEMREHDKQCGRTDDNARPRHLVWENVPGALSSNSGDDFRCVLEEIAKVVEEDADIPGPPKGGWPYSGCIMGDGYSIAYKLTDAQFHGTPQRRRRLVVVADFNGYTAPTILFDPQYRGEAERAESNETVGDTSGRRESEVQSVSESVSGDTEQSE